MSEPDPTQASETSTDSSSPEAAGPAFHGYDPDGNPTSVPLSQAAQAFQQGKIALKRGTPVPVRLPSGVIGTVTSENLSQALLAKAQIITQEEHAKAVQHATYSSTLEGLKAAGEAALRGPSMGVSDVAARALGGPELAERMRARKEEWPTLTKGVELASMVGATLATGGAEAAAEGAGAAAEGAGVLGGETALGSAGTAAEAVGAGSAVSGAESGLISRGLGAVSAPLRGINRVGNFVEHELVSKLLPKEATSLAGKLTLGALKTGARGAAEGALMGAGDYVSEEALDPNPQLSGERLLMSMGYGSLLGGLGGAGLGVAGEMGSEILGRVAPRVRHMAEEQAIRAVNPLKRGIRLTMDVPGMAAEGEASELADKIGGVRAVGREAIDSGLVQAGHDVEDIARRSPGVKSAAGEAVDGYRIKADEMGIPGPKVRDILADWTKEVMPRLSRLPSAYRGAIEKVNQIKEDLIAAVTPGLEGEAREAAVDTARVGFQQAADLRKAISDLINDNAPGIGQKPSTLNLSLKDMRRTFEDNLEKAMDKGARAYGDEGMLKGYQDAKLRYKKLALYDAMAQDALARKIANRSLSLTDYLAGGAGGAMAAGHPIAAMTALATSVAHRTVRERGNATAAALLDKISSLGMVRNAVERVERETARGVERAAGFEERIAPRVKAHLFSGDYRAKRDAVLEAAQNPDDHADDIQHVTSPFSAHSPKVANAFHVAAIRATMWLAGQLPKPKDPTTEAMMPRLAAKHDLPTRTAQTKYERQFNAVHDPVGVLDGVAKGTVTLDEVDALLHTHPEWLRDTRQQLKDRLATSKKDLPFDRLIALSKFLGEPVHPLMRPEAIRSIQQGNMTRPKPQTAPKPSKAGKATPNANKLSFASTSQLSIGGAKEDGP